MQCHEIYVILALAAGSIMAWGIGANDVSNAVGTSVGSKAITIKQAIIIAAVFEFLGAFLAGGEVVATIKQDIVSQSFINESRDLFMSGMLAALISAGLWLFLASICGWPVSTTHTIVGAIVGFGVVAGGINVINWSRVLSIVISWIMSPFLGMTISYIIFQSSQKFIFNTKNPISSAKKVVPYYILLVSWIIFMLTCTKIHFVGINLNIWEQLLVASALSIIAMFIGRNLIHKLILEPRDDQHFHFTNVEKIFAILMTFTACAMAFAHGSNDIANAIGPVAAIIQVANVDNADNNIPVHILLMGSSCIVLGLAMYGHKVIATVGTKITQLTPSRGFAATIAAAVTVVLATSTGIPISTTHTLVGGVLGVGLARGIHALNLNVIRNIILSWIVTVPAGAISTIALYKLLITYFRCNLQ